MNGPWYKGVELQREYTFLDETYSPPLVTTGELDNVIQEPTIESVSNSNDLESVSKFTGTDASMDQDIDISTSSIQQHPSLSEANHCNSLALDFEIRVPYAGLHGGTLEPMLLYTMSSTPILNEAFQSAPFVAHLTVVNTPQDQNMHSGAIHHPTHVQECCHSPENTNLNDNKNDGNEYDEDLEGDHDKNDYWKYDANIENASTTEITNTETLITNGDEADNPKPVSQQSAKKFSCTYPGCKKRYAQKGNMKAHLKTHGDPQYPCGSCSQVNR
ncbi:hypothetical protein EC991_005438 [Linnemannia zychae]|nr:hypothetical protein EC991_005438 [Linnemannia zychae]